jgi:chorismate-pyruvate lyase
MMTNSNPLAGSPAVLPYAYPLDEFYAQAGRVLPAIQQVGEDAVPEPFRQLLVHNHDMTPTLEQFHGQSIHIEVLRSEQRGEAYFREVVLLLDDSGQPVEFGAIKINLVLFPATARRFILEERLPLGHILKACHVTHSSRPKAYIRVESDDFINQALRLTGRHTLYGRRNTLLDPRQMPLAEIVEILPPVVAK